VRKLSSAILVLVAIVALTACGSSSKKTASSTSSNSSTGSSLSSAASAGAADKGDFCKQIINSKAEKIGEDPNGAKEALAILGSLTPPDEIKADWEDYLKALHELADTSSDDQAKLASIGVSHAKSLSAVSLFISQSCLNISGSELSDLSNSLSSLSQSS
jgi:hypothetical protein